ASAHARIGTSLLDWVWKTTHRCRGKCQSSSHPIRDPSLLQRARLYACVLQPQNSRPYGELWTSLVFARTPLIDARATSYSIHPQSWDQCIYLDYPWAFSFLLIDAFPTKQPVADPSGHGYFAF